MSETLSSSPSTYCNPLPLPDYPEGRLSPAKDQAWGWVDPERRDFRELADPTVLYFDDAWYLYPSGRMVYRSVDFVSWERIPLTPEDIGYAPTVCRHGDLFLLSACDAGIWAGPSPVGPFRELGPVVHADGTPLEDWMDPMLFSDEDGRLFAYWGLGQEGIRGAELDAENPRMLISEPQLLFRFDPEKEWERSGDLNENAASTYIEGAWMLKTAGRYYLIYAAPGTEFVSYCLACYVAEAPLGPFRLQERNPVLRNTDGLINGTGHGSIVAGPGESLWAFYTCLVKSRHFFERRIGMDPVRFDEGGNLYVDGASATPRPAPGREKALDWSDRAAGAVCRASSVDGESAAEDAVDDSIRSAWRADPADGSPWLELRLARPATIHALRILWDEPALDFTGDRHPRPIGYRVTARTSEGGKRLLLDAADNRRELLCDYREVSPTEVDTVRLEILTPSPAGSGVVSFSLFGPA